MYRFHQQGQRATMALGRLSTICGNTVITATATIIRMKNGNEALAIVKMSLPLMLCTTNRLKPTGGVICAISTTRTIKIPNQSRSIPAAWTAGKITEVVSNTIEIPSRKQPNMMKNTVSAASSAQAGMPTLAIQFASAAGRPVKLIADVK